MAQWDGLAYVGLALVTLGCPGREVPGGDEGAGSSAAGTTEVGATSNDSSDSGAASSTVESDSATTGSPPAACEGAMTNYAATAEVLDEGLGPVGAPVTLANCLDATAYVYQDCCYGAAFQLERKDAADAPWRTSLPSFACDCAGPIEPLVIPPHSEIVVDTNPAQFDIEPICQEPYSAIYRWTFLVGAEPDCPDCWQDVPTNEFGWYCEG